MRGSRSLVAGVALALLAVPVGATASTAGDTPTVDRVVRIDDLIESSGLAASPTHPGILWSHNDSGDVARIFGIGRRGGEVATVRLTGVDSKDAEAIQLLVVPRAGPVLVFGDIGDNAAERTGRGGAEHRLPQLLVLPEPRRLGASRVRPTLRIAFSYPDGPQDAETLLADPRDGRLYVLTKGLFGGRLFAVPPRVWPGPDGAVARRAARPGAPTARVRTTLRPVARLPVQLATDGTIRPDGAVIVRGYGLLSVFPPVETMARDRTVRPLKSTDLPEQQQGESLTLDPTRPGTVLIGSEGTDQPILRVALPQVVVPRAAADPPPTTRAAAGTTSRPSADEAGGGPGGTGREPPGQEGDPRSAVAVAAGGFAVVILIALATAVVRRRRSL